MSELHKFQWSEIAELPSYRYPFLSDFLNQNQIMNHFEFLKSEQNFLDQFHALKNNVSSIRLGFSLWNQVHLQSPKLFTESIRLKTADTLNLESVNGWWPKITFDKAVSLYLSHIEKKLITTDPVYVFGSCGVVRAIVRGLVQLGFSKINISAPNEEEVLDIIKDFESIYFNTQFTFTPRDKITLLPGIHSIVINTLKFPADDDYLRDLYFFNFLKKGGIVIDLNEIPIHTPLLYIARDIGAKIVSGYEILCFYDAFWVESILNKKINLNEYTQLVFDKLKTQIVGEEIIHQVLEEFQIEKINHD